MCRSAAALSACRLETRSFSRHGDDDARRNQPLWAFCRSSAVRTSPSADTVGGRAVYSRTILAIRLPRDGALSRVPLACRCDAPFSGRCRRLHRDARRGDSHQEPFRRKKCCSTSGSRPIAVCAGPGAVHRHEARRSCRRRPIRDSWIIRRTAAVSGRLLHHVRRDATARP